MDDFLDDFKAYILKNSDMVVSDYSIGACMLEFVAKIAKINAHHCSIVFKFEGFQLGVPSDVIIKIKCNDIVITSKRMSFADFNKLAVNGDILNVLNEVIAYEAKTIEAEQQLTNCFEIFSI